MKVEFYDDDGTLDFVEDITELRNVLDCHSYRHFWLVNRKERGCRLIDRCDLYFMYEILKHVMSAGIASLL